MWINSLGLHNEGTHEDIVVQNLYEASKSGVVLLKLIEKVTPGKVDWKKS